MAESIVITNTIRLNRSDLKLYQAKTVAGVLRRFFKLFILERGREDEGNLKGRKYLYENDSSLALCLDICSNSSRITLKTIAQCQRIQ